MEPKDLNQSSEKKMNLNSGEKPETTEEKTMIPEQETAPDTQESDPTLSKEANTETVIPKDQPSEAINSEVEPENRDVPKDDNGNTDSVPEKEDPTAPQLEKPIEEAIEEPIEEAIEEPLPEKEISSPESEKKEEAEEILAEDQPSVPTQKENIDNSIPQALESEEKTDSVTTETTDDSAVEKPVTQEAETVPEKKEPSSVPVQEQPAPTEVTETAPAEGVASEKEKTTAPPPLAEKPVAATSDLLSPDDMNYASLTREILLVKFSELLNNHPLQLIKGHLELIRSTFEGKTAREHAALKKKFMESGEAEENFAQPNDPLLVTFGDLLYAYRKQRDENRTRREEEKKMNLEAKYEVIENIKDLINRQESLNVTFQEFRDLQQKWRDIGPVPQKEMHDMWENYHLHVENFYNYTKINKELRDLDLKKNYETKLELCELAEALLLEPTIVKAFKTLQKYHDRWRETGPVPRENKEELWMRFKETTAKINQKHQEHFENIKKQFEKNLQDKRELCEQAETFLEKEFRNAREWESGSKAIIELQQVWKTIGFAPKKENTEVYHRFRNTCDTFFSKKRDFFKQYKDSQIKNLELKTELCLQAETMKDSEEWKNTTNEFIRIQKRWKEIGPVPRRSSDAIWKRFREACDHFFNKKSQYFNKKDEAQDENLKLKEQLIEDLKQYKPGTNNEENFNNLQEFQSRWSKIGFVPFKDKDRLSQEFRQLINGQFDQLNMDESNKMIQKYRSKVESWNSEGASRDRIIQERNKIIGKLKLIENDISIWENNIGFFAKSKSSDALIRDFNHKIESGKRLIKSLNQKLDLLDEMYNRS